MVWLLLLSSLQISFLAVSSHDLQYQPFKGVKWGETSARVLVVDYGKLICNYIVHTMYTTIHLNVRFRDVIKMTSPDLWTFTAVGFKDDLLCLLKPLSE